MLHFYPFQNLSWKNGEHNVIELDMNLTPRRNIASAIYYLDSMTHEQDPVYGGLKR